MLEPEKSLYHRLGGYDVIAAFVDDLLPRLFGDPQIGVYWKGKSADSLKRERQMAVDFLSAATGGPVNYLGRDMKTSHQGIGISESDWNIFVEHAVEVLNNLAIAEKEKNDFLAAAGSLKGEIVEGATKSSGASA